MMMVVMGGANIVAMCWVVPFSVRMDDRWRHRGPRQYGGDCHELQRRSAHTIQHIFQNTSFAGMVRPARITNGSFHRRSDVAYGQDYSLELEGLDADNKRRLYISRRTDGRSEG